MAWLFAAAGGWASLEYQCGTCKAMKRYQRRNCRKHFPELVEIGRPASWVPRFKTGGDKPVPFMVPGYAMKECPVSAITPRSMHLLELVRQNSVVHEAAGGGLFGPNAGEWPAWWHDALAAVAAVRSEYERAREKARA